MSQVLCVSERFPKGANSTGTVKDKENLLVSP